MSYTRDESHVDPYGPATHHEGGSRSMADRITTAESRLDWCVAQLAILTRRVETLQYDLRRAKQAARDAHDGLDREVHG